ncbi:hypothetical protein RRG08_011732 [Elysia crispata]|uniref:Uncharacterized protein n=1 Tax=Elysia crispata TaxID=231223 RepID=A0AAE1AG16_9GAST|nr:hypothetical protein RRG08_011732 [Elysia crispata]
MFSTISASTVHHYSPDWVSLVSSMMTEADLKKALTLVEYSLLPVDCNSSSETELLPCTVLAPGPKEVLPFSADHLDWAEGNEAKNQAEWLNASTLPLLPQLSRLVFKEIEGH